MAKPMLVTLPFVMLLLDYWPLRRIPDFEFRIPNLARLTLEKWPFFLLTTVSCVVTFVAQRHGEAVMALQQFPLNLRVVNALISYEQYLAKMIWPWPLAVFYPLPNHLSWIHQAMASTVVAVLGILSWLAWRTRRPCPYLLVGWLWFLGTLVPVIGLVQIGSAALADRYSYFPLVGLFIVVAFGARDLTRRFRFPKMAAAVAAALALVACLVLTENQLRYWHDSKSLFAHALTVTSDNVIAHIDYGVALEHEGLFAKALTQYREAARLDPDDEVEHFDIGNLLEKTGKPEEALPELLQAVRLNPKAPSAHNVLGIVLVELGRFDEAMSEFAGAARLDPAYPWPYFQMGKALLGQGRDAEAIDKLREALRINPDNYQILAYVARVLAANEKPGVRDGQTALVYAVKANVLSDGTLPFVLDALGMACAETGRFDDAQEAIKRAIKIATVAGMKQDVASLQQRLRLYQNHQPWRESFLSTNTLPVDLPQN
jgi:tetratricopeptide (TPR) repeat protein